IYYLYIVCYSILRFILEFYRGDSVRGLFGGISTSQIISIILFVLAITTYFIKKVKVSSYYTKQEK
ncbi:MAG: prolipoprotein diacylglyceryl transferase family protein, partial [Treponemataceae bacterium]|nr:prolipoprotein diacylglyceryl transferase family protein [Treponemataceae bacterium]